MAPAPVITKKRPQEMTPEEYQQDLRAAAGIEPAANTNATGRAVNASVTSPQAEAMMLSRGSAGHEGLAMGKKAQALQSKKNDVVEEAGYKNQLIDIAQAEQEAANWTQKAREQQFAADQAEDEKIRRTAELKAQEEDIARTSAELAKTTIDPERKEKSRGFGERFANGIAAALLGFGSGAAGVDVVMKRIQNENEADIQSQKDQYAAKQMGLKGKETLYEKMLQRYGTEDAATAATRAAGLEQTKLQAQAWAAKAKGPEAQKRFNELYGNIEAHRFEELQRNMKVIGASQGKVAWRMPNGDMVTGTPDQFNAYKMQTGIKDADATRAAGVSVATEQAKGEVKGKDDAAKAAKDERERFVPTGPEGQGYYAPTTEEAKKSREQRQSISEMRGTINEIRKLREEMTFGDRAAAAGGVETPRIKKLKSLGNSLLMSTNKGAGLGALDNGSVKVLEGVLGEIHSANPVKDPMPQLEAVLSGADRTLGVSESGASGYTQTAPKGAQKGW